MAVNNSIDSRQSLSPSASPSFTGLTLSGSTAHSLLLGEASSSIVSLGAATNGQIPIGSTGADPVLATISAGTNVSISNGAGSITISSSTSSIVVNYTNVTTSPYVVLSTDYYLGVNTSTVKSIQLPNAPTTGRIFVIKDFSGLAATNNIAITTVGGVVLIDGFAIYGITANYGSVQLIFNGTSYEVY